jgi:hypothetical protein
MDVSGHAAILQAPTHNPYQMARASSDTRQETRSCLSLTRTAVHSASGGNGPMKPGRGHPRYSLAYDLLYRDMPVDRSDPFR